MRHRPLIALCTIAMVVVVGLALRSVIAQSRSRDGVFQTVPPGEARGRGEAQDTSKSVPAKPRRTDFARTSEGLPGKTLPQVLRPEDSSVEVIVYSGHEARDTTDPIAELEGLTRGATAVVVVRCADVQGQLAACRT